MPTGTNIKKIRLEKGLSQKQLGDICGMADSAIRRYENGKANPKLETLEKISKALDVPLTALIDTAVLKLEQDVIDLFSGSGDLEVSIDLSELNRLYCLLNATGQSKAIEQVEMLTKIPEYTEKEK